MVHGIPPYGSTPPPEQGSIPPADRQKLEQLEQSLANDPSALAQGIKQKIEDYLNGSTPYPANGLKGVFADINQTFFQQQPGSNMDVYGANSGLINSGGDSIANIQKLFSNIASACGVHANSPPVTAMDKKIAAFVEGYKMNPTTDLLHFLRIELNSLGSEGSLKDLKAFGQMQMQHQNFKEASPAEQALFKNICGC